jgi:type IV secretion system protein VirB5
MKKFIAILAFIASTMFGTSANAQIPVTDGASIAQDIMSQVETMAKWKEQYDQMTQQIDQLKQQYQAITGTRGLGDILNNPSLSSYLPAEWQQVYNQVRQGGYAGLTGSARSIFDQAKVFERCGSLRGSEKIICESDSAKSSQDLAFANEAYDNATRRLDQINGLMRRINSTTDQKAIAELQARIASEQNAIQNEATKLQMFSVVAQANDRMIQERRSQEFTRSNQAPAQFPRAQTINWGTQ